MAFEKTILAICEDAGVEGAYFAYGTLFVPAEQSKIQSNDELARVFDGFKVQVNNAGDEVAVDFVA